MKQTMQDDDGDFPWRAYDKPTKEPEPYILAWNVAQRMITGKYEESICEYLKFSIPYVFASICLHTII